MEYRALGDTGLTVSALGIGLEYLKKGSRGDIAKVIGEAVSEGVNYFDLVWSLPQVIEGVTQGIGNAGDIHLAVHLGSSYRDGKYVKAKSNERCEETFRETLKRLDKDSVSIINIHYIRALKQWNQAVKAGGVLDLAVSLRDEGLGEIIGISTHSVDLVKRAAMHPEIRSVMFQVNMANHHLQGRYEALRLCRDRGMGIVAMKPYAGGNLLKVNRKVSFPKYKTGGLSMKLRIPDSMTDIKCLHYSLSQPGVNCAVSGPKNLQELQSTLSYLQSDQETRDYQSELGKLS